MAVGSAVVDFGAFPGSSLATVTITDQATIAANAFCEAWIAAVATADHTITDHAYTASLVNLTCGAATAGVGFTIYASCLDRMQGTFNINWVWYNPL